MKYTIATTCKDPNVIYKVRAPWLKTNGFKFNWDNKYWYKTTTKAKIVEHTNDILSWKGWIVYSKQG